MYVDVDVIVIVDVISYYTTPHYRVYFPTFTNESMVKITNTPKNEYKTNSSATRPVLWSRCSSIIWIR